MLAPILTRITVVQGVYGHDSGDDNIWNNYMPISSSIWKFYQGQQAGDNSQMAWGAGLLLLDIASFGLEGTGVKVLDIVWRLHYTERGSSR